MPELHLTKASTPCRLAWWVSLLTSRPESLKLVEVDLSDRKEHLSSEFVSMNPRHCVPTYREGDFVLTESRAIAGRFLRESGQYQPETEDERSRMEEMVQYDLGTFYRRIADYVYPQLFRGESGDSERLELVEESLRYLDGVLERRRGTMSGGTNFTLADFTVRMSLTMLSFTSVDLDDYPRVREWSERLERLDTDSWERVDRPFREWVNSKLAVRK